jgi:hypothetical protein
VWGVARGLGSGAGGWPAPKKKVRVGGLNGRWGGGRPVEAAYREGGVPRRRRSGARREQWRQAVTSGRGRGSTAGRVLAEEDEGMELWRKKTTSCVEIVGRGPVMILFRCQRALRRVNCQLGAPERGRSREGVLAKKAARANCIGGTETWMAK